MLNKIKFIGIIFLSILLLTNCKKEAKQDQTQQGELVFAPIDITPDKTDWDWECNFDLTVIYAKVTIDGTDYYPLTFVVDGKLYTQAIKLDAGDHVLEYFALMDDMGTPDSKLDDEIVKATPMDDSDFAEFVEYALPEALTIVAFQKFELKIDVLCYIPAVYEYFGFFWFEVVEMTIREQCFFGDFCLPNLTDYEGSLYDLNGLLIDEVAIFKIKAYRNGEFIRCFKNTHGGGGNHGGCGGGHDDEEGEDHSGCGGGGNGNGGGGNGNGGGGDEVDDITFKEPLCVQYADYDNAEDHFEFELWIYVKVGDEFKYVFFHTWEFMDAEKIDTGGDGIVEFVLGDCVYSETDLLLPPYINQYFTGIDTPVSVIDDGDTTYFDDGSILIEGYISEFYEQADDWRVRGISIWYITFPFAPDGSATPFGTAEIFVGADPDNSAYTGKWDIVHTEVLTPTDVGFDILGHTVGIGVEGDVLGLYAKWTYTMSFDAGDPSTFVYYFTGYINSQVQFEL